MLSANSLFVGFPFQNIAMVASIYMTVVIALERYIAVSRPIRAYVADGDQEGMIKSWLNVLKYAGPVVLFSVVINISTFLEFFVHCEDILELEDPNQTSICHSCPHLRLEENYIKYYNNLFREDFSNRQNNIFFDKNYVT